VAKVTRVYHSDSPGSIPSENLRSLERTLGSVEIEWLDWAGPRNFVQLTFPALSSAYEKTGKGEILTIIPYGDLSMPSPGDVVIVGFLDHTNAVIVGYLPHNYKRLTDPARLTQTALRPVVQGTLRRVKPGEFSRTSRQQAEIYQDKAGATQIIVKAQPVSGSDATDGSATAKASDINPAAVPSEEIARVTIGESYTDDNFTAREMTAGGKKVILRIKTAKGTKINIDVDGNIEMVGVQDIGMTAKTISLSNGNGVEMDISESGINIDSGDTPLRSVTINGEFPVLYSTKLGAVSVETLAEIGVSQTVKVGQ